MVGCQAAGVPGRRPSKSWSKSATTRLRARSIPIPLIPSITSFERLKFFSLSDLIPSFSIPDRSAHQRLHGAVLFLVISSLTVQYTTQFNPHTSNRLLYTVQSSKSLNVPSTSITTPTSPHTLQQFKPRHTRHTALHVLTTPESIIESTSTQDLLDDLIDVSTRVKARRPIILQFDPTGNELWKKWRGTGETINNSPVTVDVTLSHTFQQSSPNPGFPASAIYSSLPPSACTSTSTPR